MLLNSLLRDSLIRSLACSLTDWLTQRVRSCSLARLFTDRLIDSESQKLIACSLVHWLADWLRESVDDWLIDWLARSLTDWMNGLARIECICQGHGSMHGHSLTRLSSDWIQVLAPWTSVNVTVQRVRIERTWNSIRLRRGSKHWTNITHNLHRDGECYPQINS